MEYLTPGEKIAKIINYAVLALLAVACLFPFYYVIVISMSPESEVVRKGIVLFPDTVTWNAYREMFRESYALDQAYKVTLFRTIVGTALNLLITFMTAYPLSKKMLPGRSVFMFYIVFTMLFSGGMIPTYLVVQSLGLTNTIWALIVPGLVGAFNVIIMKSFFEQLPPEIEESAKVDGAGELQTMARIVFPLTMPVMATVGLFYMVFHWNSYFDGVLYISKPELNPLQVVLRTILLSVQQQNAEINQYGDDRLVSSHAIKMAAVVLTTVPILLVYPFIQKYFTKGAMLGAVKG
ncbi:carbohydrate ABC transporter permease [Paenibacillus sp. YN15]|uniref:carbohydrate ABC transporter permease n=1 Tax=Paenibacillus sp. YN15 TaxID=1742774 RepID=UPI000DCE9900|nr:carbohydrate ABC transporter permease [Paenibacillus sp. YN15]RAU94705.1 ABC transporter permease [Paenibacillus sp. YN15]